MAETECSAFWICLFCILSFMCLFVIFSTQVHKSFWKSAYLAIGTYLSPLLCSWLTTLLHFSRYVKPVLELVASRLALLSAIPVCFCNCVLAVRLKDITWQSEVAQHWGKHQHRRLYHFI